VFHRLGRAVLCNVGGFLSAAVKHTGEGGEDVEVQSGLWEGEKMSEMIRRMNNSRDGLGLRGESQEDDAQQSEYLKLSG